MIIVICYGLIESIICQLVFIYKLLLVCQIIAALKKLKKLESEAELARLERRLKRVFEWAAVTRTCRTL